MYWIWEVKPEAGYCCEGLGGVVGELDMSREVFRRIFHEAVPLDIPFPGYELKELTDGAPRPPGDYLDTGSDNLLSSRLRGILEAHGVEAEYYPIEVKAKSFNADQAFYYMRLLPRIRCLHRGESIYEVEKMGAGDEWIRNISKMVVDESLIPQGIALLRMDETPVMLASDALKNDIENSGITCVHFIRPEDYPRSHIINGDLWEAAQKKRRSESQKQAWARRRAKKDA